MIKRLGDKYTCSSCREKVSTVYLKKGRWLCVDCFYDTEETEDAKSKENYSEDWQKRKKARAEKGGRGTSELVS
jgi:ribosomal protein L37AE/L43A